MNHAVRDARILGLDFRLLADRLALVFHAPVLEAHDQRHRQLRIVAIKVQEVRALSAEVAAALPQELLPAGDVGRGFVEVADDIEQWWWALCHWRGQARLSVGPKHGIGRMRSQDKPKVSSIWRMRMSNDLT